jgi:proteasome lid subunit RPN8/RPN11
MAWNVTGVASTVSAVLFLTAEVRDHLFAHALEGLPHEACGMLSVKNGSALADRFHSMRNAAESAMIFSLDPQEMVDIEQMADDAGRTLHGVMHSHTHTSAYPSPTDVSDITRFDPFGAFHHLIVSLRHAEPVMRSYAIVDGEIIEEPIVIDGDEPVLQDGAGAVAAVSQLPRPSPRS